MSLRETHNVSSISSSRPLGKPSVIRPLNMASCHVYRSSPVFRFAPAALDHWFGGIVIFSTDDGTLLRCRACSTIRFAPYLDTWVSRHDGGIHGTS